MEFGSSYVYVYDEPEFEVISDEEYEEGMNLSEDSESDESETPVSSKTDTDANVADGPRTVSSDVADASGLQDLCKRGSPPPPLPPALRHKPRAHNWRNINDDEMYMPVDKSVPGRRERRADTNVVSIDFSKLIAPSHMFTGDPVYCQQCKAILSHISKITKRDEQQVWTCEFCNTDNNIDIMEEELPKEKDITFMLEPALSTTAAGPSGTDESLVIFCIDVSGSMCVTTEVPGNINFRGSLALSRIQRTREDQRDQYLPRQRRDVTFVSRLQAAQAAVDHQLEEMLKEHPNRRVALIAFNNEVTVIGDGKETPVTVAGSKLTNKDELVQIGKDLKMPVSVKDTRKQLGDHVFSLEEGGATALGPALLIATTMAAQHAGSKVIVCTDGMANIGMGRLDQEDQMQEGEFYEEVGLEASTKGVTISVISIKGTDCKLVHLGKLADTTGGQVNIVDPLKLTQEFSTILADRIIATNVVATFLLHKQLFVQNEDKQESKIVRQIGNVTASTEITFEYGIRTGTKQDGGEDPVPMEIHQEGDQKQVPSSEGASSSKGQGFKFKVEVPDELPFQLQIKYKDTEGATALRVLTQTRPVTRDRKQAEQRTNAQVIGTHAQKHTSALALEGRYTDSRVKAMMNQRLMWRHKRMAPKGSTEAARSEEMYGEFVGKISEVENKLKNAVKKEKALFGRTHSDSEGEDEEELPRGSMMASLSAPPTRIKLKGAKKTRAMRSKDISDSFYLQLHQQNNPTKLSKPSSKEKSSGKESDSD